MKFHPKLSLEKVYRASIFGLLWVFLPISVLAQSESQSQPIHRFDFGPGEVESGYTQVTSNTIFTWKRGYGFLNGSTIQDVDRGGNDALTSDFCNSSQPFVFAVAIPEGNYNVSITFGDRQGESRATIRAESRRLMLENIQTNKGEFTTRVFTTNVRYPTIAGTENLVRLKPREKFHANWDKLLTIEFNGPRPCVCAVEITPADNVITLYLAGNSTVTDQKMEPYSAWGQMLPRFSSQERSSWQIMQNPVRV